MMKRQERAAAPSETLVYCGPSIPGLAKQFTVYAGGQVPAELQRRVQELPALEGLLIPLSQLPSVRAQLRAGMGPLYRLYLLAQDKYQKEV